MAECSVSDSFIARVYRFDTEDSRKIVRLVEATDGSRLSEAITDTDALGMILNCFVNRNKKSRRRIKTKADSL